MFKAAVDATILKRIKDRLELSDRDIFRDAKTQRLQPHLRYPICGDNGVRPRVQHPPCEIAHLIGTADPITSALLFRETLLKFEQRHAREHVHIASA